MVSPYENACFTSPFFVLCLWYPVTCCTCVWSDSVRSYRNDILLRVSHTSVSHAKVNALVTHDVVWIFVHDVEIWSHLHYFEFRIEDKVQHAKLRYTYVMRLFHLMGLSLSWMNFIPFTNTQTHIMIIRWVCCVRTPAEKSIFHQVASAKFSSSSLNYFQMESRISP